MRATKRFLIASAALAALAPFASAYYYWMFFPGAGSSSGLPGRFDLSALKDKTVQYFISDQGPASLVGGDSTNALFTQIQQAAQVWNKVPTSALRLSYGGVSTIGTPQSVPGIDVVFDDDMPPGILAQTIPTFPADLTFLTGDPKTLPNFVPLQRSKLQLRSDLASQSQSSFSDEFFLTLVHEFGHAVGLQHTLTSSVMSTSITRATLRGSPLAPDDIAGVSLLYPTAGYTRGTGSISGNVTLKGNGVNLASVVALSTGGTVISALTNPDGSYRIDGIPADSYYVYAHPLPPPLTGEHAPANINPPSDPAGDDFSAVTGFSAQFYPGTQDWTKAKQVAVTPRTVASAVNFAVAARSAPAVSSMETYGYQGDVAVATPPLVAGTAGIPLVFHASGATVASKTNDGQAVAPGLNVSTIGGAAQIGARSLKYYTQGFLQMSVDTTAVTTPTPVALAVTLNNDLYVLPAGFTVVPNGPPSIISATPYTDDSGTLLVAITGANLSAQTAIRMDGALASNVALQDDGTLVVAPPPAPSGTTATIEAVNSDGQTSLQALAITPAGAADRALFGYPQRDDAAIGVTPSLLKAGRDTWVAINGTNTHFAHGRTSVGIGMSDVAVRHVWAVSPTLLMVNVSVGAGAQLGTTNLTVATGLEQIVAAGAITVQAPDDDLASLQLPILSAVTGLPGVPPGDPALIATAGINPANGALNQWLLTIGGAKVPFIADNNGVLTAQVPPQLAAGPQIVQLISPQGRPVAPVLMNRDQAPPVIASIFVVQGDGTLATVSTDTPAHPGDTLQLAVLGLGNAPPPDIWFNLAAINDSDAARAAINYPVISTMPGPPKSGATLVQIQLPQDFPLDPGKTAKLSVMAGIGTRLSGAFDIVLMAPSAQ